MARLLLIASILLGFGTAFLGYKTKQQADELQGKLKSTSASLNQTRTKLTSAEKELGETKKRLDDTTATLKQKEEEVVNAKAAAEKAKADYATAQAAVDEANKKIQAAEAAVEELKKTFPQGVDMATLPQTLGQLQTDIAKFKTERDEAVAVAESLKARSDELTASVETKDRTIQEYKTGYVRQGLSGKVVAYNPGWNFVVLNIGDKAGLKAGVQMVVLRGGNMVGKLKVTSVEPNTAIADVLPGTLARGDSVQPGDSVVFEGNRR
ncbi:MAG TPA: hypothetical protein VFG14_12285 [Chthoniobacteraceae bacterium]|nr:hypothetical protein [Chthoniobacteraceae bacterium]